MAKKATKRVVRKGEEGLTREDIIELRLAATMKLEPEVKMTVKGKTYTLVVNNRTAKDILKDTQVNLLGAGFSVEALDDPNTLSSILYRALQKHHSDITTDVVDEELLNMRHLFYIRRKIVEAVSLFLPDLEDMPETEANDGSGETDTQSPT